MLHVARSALAALLLALTAIAPGQTEATQEGSVRIPADGRAVIRRPAAEVARTAASGTRPFARTELYFGTARRNGVVTEAVFRTFVDRYVTPQFPDGLTVLKGDGQFRDDEDHAVTREQSFVLILLYPYDALVDGSRRIERIRMLYKEAFDQRSVLRVDGPSIVWVSF